MVVEVVGLEGMAGHLVEPRDRGSGVVTAVDELFDPKYCLSNRELPVVRTPTASQRVANLVIKRFTADADKARRQLAEESRERMLP